MLNVLFFFDSAKPPQKSLNALSSDSVLLSKHTSFDSAYTAAKSNKYDLAVIQIGSPNSEGMRLLRCIYSENLCRHRAVYMPTRDFDALCAALKYDICGCITGIDTDDFPELLEWVLQCENEPVSTSAYETELAEMFVNRDVYIHKYMVSMLDSLEKTAANSELSETLLRQIYTNVIKYIFENVEWADLYFSEDMLLKRFENGRDSFSAAVTDFFCEYSSLSPRVTDDRISRVIRYILSNPENDLRLKNISKKFYMNSTYLSTVFTAQAKIRFVDYIISVKLKRAAFLLKNVSLKITEIAERLGYKDMGYFSKIFKKQYGMTPTEYRTPDNYIYEI